MSNSNKDLEGAAFFLTLVFYASASYGVGMSFGSTFGVPMFLFLVGTIFHTVFKESFGE